MPAGDVVAVCVEARGVWRGHVRRFEPGVGIYCVLEMHWTMRAGLGGGPFFVSVFAAAAATTVGMGVGAGEEWRVVVIAGKVEIHAYTC